MVGFVPERQENTGKSRKCLRPAFFIFPTILLQFLILGYKRSGLRCSELTDYNFYIIISYIFLTNYLKPALKDHLLLEVNFPIYHWWSLNPFQLDRF